MVKDNNYEHSPSKFPYLLERWKVTNVQPSSRSQDVIKGFINNHKRVNATKKATTNMDALFRYIKSSFCEE